MDGNCSVASKKAELWSYELITSKYWQRIVSREYLVVSTMSGWFFSTANVLLHSGCFCFIFSQWELWLELWRGVKLFLTINMFFFNNFNFPSFMWYDKTTMVMLTKIYGLRDVMICSEIMIAHKTTYLLWKTKSTRTCVFDYFNPLSERFIRAFIHFKPERWTPYWNV